MNLNSDTDILSATRSKESGGKTSYMVEVPGHGVVEGAMNGSPSFDNNLQWCSYVRSEINARQNREEAEAFSRRAALESARGRLDASADESGGREAPAEGDLLSSETSLEEIITAKVASLRRSRETLKAAIADQTNTLRALDIELVLAEELEKVYARQRNETTDTEASKGKRGTKGSTPKPRARPRRTSKKKVGAKS